MTASRSGPAKASIAAQDRQKVMTVFDTGVAFQQLRGEVARDGAKLGNHVVDEMALVGGPVLWGGARGPEASDHRTLLLARL